MKAFGLLFLLFLFSLSGSKPILESKERSLIESFEELLKENKAMRERIDALERDVADDIVNLNKTLQKHSEHINFNAAHLEHLNDRLNDNTRNIVENNLNIGNNEKLIQKIDERLGATENEMVNVKTDLVQEVDT